MYMEKMLEQAGLLEIHTKIQQNQRLSYEDGLQLYRCPDILAVGYLADIVRNRKNGNDTFFIYNQHINYSNICTPYDAACIIYTSGSTGEPKGIVMENRSIVNLVYSFIRSYKPGPGDNILPLTSIASASFVGEILPMITSGGGIVLADKVHFLDMKKLTQLMTDFHITILSTVPSMIARLNNGQWNPGQLRLLLSGGETLSAGDIDRLRESITIVNGYGLTEGTICSTFIIINKEDEKLDKNPVISVGKPIINTQIYILDQQKNPVPIGVTGELYIGGDGITRGYLNNPEMTAEKFIQPFNYANKSRSAQESHFPSSSTHPLTYSTLFRTGDTTGAIIELENAAALDSTYDPRVWFSISRMYEMQQQYSAAARALDSYLRLASLDVNREERLNRHVEDLEFRQDLVDNPVPFAPIPVPGTINTEYHEALPAVTIDGMTMIFTRRIGGFEDIYIAGWDSIGNQWIGALPMKAINTAQNEGAHTISANGRVLVFTSCNRKDGVGSCDLYLTFKRSDGNWSEVRNLRSINSRGWDGQPALTADGRGLYFSSDRPGGKGNRDIWFTRITGSGWTEPENLGPVINTAQNESSPFVHRDDRTMYFMSDGHPGMGDYDLFISKRDTGEWTKPTNLGFPINTPGREGALTVHPNGLTAYYTRESDDFGTMDIYQFELPEDAVPDPVSYLDVVVTDAADGRPVVAVAWVYALTDTTRRDRYVADGGGRVSAGLPHGRKYGMHITAPGYLFFSTQFDLDRTEPYQRISIEVGLQPIIQDGQESSPVILRNVEFESGSADLLESSVSELKLLLQLLRSDSEVHMEIRGHTDNVGDPQSNLTLSKQRAESVYNWLIEAGVDPERLTYEGFGEMMPIDSNDTEEGRQRNRRTEFKLLR